MKKLIFLAAIFSFLVSCEKHSYSPDSFLTARIVKFDMNCSTCIIEFPDDPSKVNELIGSSTENYYNAVNMNMNDYHVGQKLKVMIRKAEAGEQSNCITLYPTFDYQGIIITAFEGLNAVTFNDTLELSYHNCLIDSENNVFFCLDSVRNDSRCPSGVECFWAGNAAVQFKIEKYKNDPILFTLNSTIYPRDTSVYGYKVSLVELMPYPAFGVPINQKDYIARIIIRK